MSSWRLAALALLASTAALAQQPASELVEQQLQRLHSARQLSYSATLVIASNNQLQTFQVGPDTIAAGTGATRLLRSGDGGLRLEDAGAALELPHRQWFTRAAPPTLAQLQLGYTIELRPLEVVDGRETVALHFEPRDRWRYGSTLWLDRSTGLVLKTELRDAEARPLAQSLLVQLQLGGRAEPSTEPAAGSGPADAGRWQVQGLPEGFAVTRATREQDAEQLLVSDGLAAISVFVEPLAAGVAPQRGQQQRGILVALAEVRGDYQLVAVGAVPPQTIERVLSGVGPR